MESALSHLFGGHNLVHLAAAIYLAGFLFRDQIMLRALLIVGDVVYTAYYVSSSARHRCS
jgi:hypothetical protein